MQSFELLTKVIVFHKNRGFTIQCLLADPEFECLKPRMLKKHGAEVNPSSAKDHVADTGWQICMVKERVCSCFSLMPCKHKPQKASKCTVSHCAKWVNSFPCKGSCTPSVSPQVLTTGKKPEHAKHCKIEVGACAQVHLNREKTNGMEACTTGTITLGTNDSIQSGYKFVSATTGEVLRFFCTFPHVWQRH